MVTLKLMLRVPISKNYIYTLLVIWYYIFNKHNKCTMSQNYFSCIILYHVTITINIYTIK